MDVIDANTAWKDRAFYFCGKLERPLDAKIWHFRSEEAYDAEEQPEVTSMTLVRKFAKCLGKRPILVLFSDLATPSALRTKKGVLWEHKDLRPLPHVAFEVECGAESRLGAVVDLADFSFDSSASAVLNWGRGLIVLSTETLDNVKQRAEHWASTDAGDVLAFDYDAIALSLHQNTAFAILRYLPPSHSRPETIVVVAEKHLVDEGVCKCIDSII